MRNSKPVTTGGASPLKMAKWFENTACHADTVAGGTVTAVLNTALDLASLLHLRLDSLFGAMEGDAPCDAGKMEARGQTPIEPAAVTVTEQLRTAVDRLDIALARLR